MSVILNEAFIKTLLETERGPVGRALDRTANVIAGNGEAIINLILENPAIRPRVDHVVEQTGEGLQARIGIPFQGRVSGYMADKWEREADVWIRQALMQGWDSRILG